MCLLICRLLRGREKGEVSVPVNVVQRKGKHSPRQDPWLGSQEATTHIPALKWVDQELTESQMVSAQAWLPPCCSAGRLGFESLLCHRDHPSVSESPSLETWKCPHMPPAVWEDL